MAGGGLLEILELELRNNMPKELRCSECVVIQRRHSPPIAIASLLRFSICHHGTAPLPCLHSPATVLFDPAPGYHPGRAGSRLEDRWSDRLRATTANSVRPYAFPPDPARCVRATLDTRQKAARGKTAPYFVTGVHQHSPSSAGSSVARGPSHARNVLTGTSTATLRYGRPNLH